MKLFKKAALSQVAPLQQLVLKGFFPHVFLLLLFPFLDFIFLTSLFPCLACGTSQIEDNPSHPRTALENEEEEEDEEMRRDEERRQKLQKLQVYSHFLLSHSFDCMTAHWAFTDRERVV